jgi:4-hydroxy-3-polyprenylbenzoate decarboxylase
MERAREIWEELGLPHLEPQMPWYGYSLGLWSDEWEDEANLAVESRFEETAEKMGSARTSLDMDTTLKDARRKWAETKQGRSE